MFIYQICNVLNGKKYIGMTRQKLSARFRAHKYRVKSGDQKPLYAAMRKYGIENFSIEIIAEAGTYDELSRLEIDLIAEHSTVVPNGYNLAPGGQGSPGFRKDKEAVEKTASWHRGKKRSEEARIAMSESQTGVKRERSKEVTERIAQAHVGLKRTNEQRARMAEAQSGKTHSEETKRKISEALRGKNKTASSIEKAVAKRRGVPLSMEHKEKLKEAWQRRKNAAKTCSSCGCLSGPTGLVGLAVRQWQCPECGSEHDRDINAACNTLLLGLEQPSNLESRHAA